ncbi:MAG TPA: Crp/Fnr family transcriptional regulator, partial [Abditibacterium sp.]
HLRPTLFHLGTVLFESGSESEAVYFPKSGIVSLVLTSAIGINVEVGLVGPEGVAGMMDALTQSKHVVRAHVQSAGSGWRLPSEILREEFVRNPEFRQALIRYEHELSSMTAQNALCNRLHSVSQRLAKWLLLVQDRMQNDELELTHEFIATMLGTRREAVTLAIHALRDAGIISHRRGFISVLDRSGLEALACECYSLLRDSPSYS